MQNPVEPRSELRIRPAESSDISEILDIERMSFSAPWSREAFGHLFDRPNTAVWVAEERSVPGLAGYAVLWWVEDEGDLANFAIHSERRGRGLGGVFLDRVLRDAAGFGVLEIYLEVRHSNESALRLYRSRGFKRVGFRRNYYTHPKEDADVFLWTHG